MAREYKLKSPKVSDDHLVKWGKYGTPPTRIADIPADYLAWCWGKFLHKTPEKPEHQYIVQNIDTLDKETDVIFSPDPRTLKK